MAIPFNNGDGYCPIEYDPPIRPHPWSDWWDVARRVELLPDLVAPTSDWRIDLEMPGVKKSSISVKVKGPFVLVTWTDRLGAMQHRSLHVGTKYYDLTKINVVYENGLLDIHVPRIPPPPPPPEDPEIEIEIK